MSMKISPVTSIITVKKKKNTWKNDILKKTYFYFLWLLRNSKESIWLESCIYTWQAFIISPFICTRHFYSLAIQKQANRVVSLIVWHVISVEIWHSGLYKGMNKDIVVIFFCTCVQQCSGTVSHTFVAESIVPVSDCSWIGSEPQRHFEQKNVQNDVH